ncbi:unnamed protein product, partial [Ectocarpus fasciculatus]
EEAAKRWLVNPFDVKMELHLSVMPNDPSVSQLKVYGDLPRLHVRLSQDKLRRLARMSVAIAAQSAAALAVSSASTAAGDGGPSPPPGEGALLERDGGDLRAAAANSDASNDGDGGGGGGMSSLASFLEFQRSLSQRFDHLHQPREGSAPSPGDTAAAVVAPLGRRELRRLRLSD